jgi:hypothetical protein
MGMIAHSTLRPRRRAGKQWGKEMAMRMIGLAAILAVAGAVPAQAEAPEMRCLVPSHRWDGAEPLTALRAASGVPVVRPGQAAMIRLVDAAKVRFLVPLRKPITAGDKGGLVILAIRNSGSYRIALQRKAWIDVMRDGKTITSAAHAHGLPCSNIAKTVDFALARGVYTLQLSGAADETIGLSVTKQS